MPMDQIAKLEPVARARALGPDLEAAANEIERIQDFPEPLATRLHEAGMFRLLLPRSVGGEEVHPSAYLEAIMEVSRHEGSVGWNLFVANSSCLLAPFVPFETANEIYENPRAVVAWGPPNQYKLKAVDGGYRVTGKWPFASGSAQATWMGAHGPVEEADGSLRLNERGTPLIRSVLFPADQATLLNDWNPVGLKGTCSQSYRVDDVFVPEARSGTREAPEARRDQGPLYAFTQQGLYAVGVAAVSLGIARAMLDEFHDLAADKTPRGRGRLAEDKLTQADYARAEARLGSALAYLHHILGDVYDRADDVEPIGIEDRAMVRLACSNAIQAGVETADWVHRAAGVSAIFPGSPFERRWRDIHTVSQQIQSRPSHFEAVGGVLLGEPPEVFY